MVLALAGVQRARADASAILAETDARILKNRTGTLQVQVLNRNGKPSANTKIQLEHTGHIFKFGAAYHRQFPVERPPENEIEQRHLNAFLKLFNYATVTFYWNPYEPRQGKPEEAQRLAAIDWMNRHGIGVRGHPIFWNLDGIVPRWVNAQGTNGDALTRLMDVRLEGLSKTILPRMEDADVFNELVEWNRFTNAFTALARKDIKEPVIHYLREAKRLNPALKTVVNDYVTDKRFPDLLRALMDGGAPIDIVGQQCHMHSSEWSAENTWNILERLSKLNRPIVFSELSVLSGPHREKVNWFGHVNDWLTDPEHEKSQAAYLEQFYKLIYSHPQSMGIVLWNYDDRQAWLGAPVGILRKDGTPKPSFEVLDRLINHEWRTQGEFTTDNEGKIAVANAFEGNYLLKAGVATATGDHTAGKPLIVTLRLP
jgi:GH35 family endo-1,4-beta-xylanase